MTLVFRINIYDLFVVVQKNINPIANGCQEDEKERKIRMMNKDDDGAGGVEHFFEKKFYACLTKKNVRYIKQVKAMRS